MENEKIKDFREKKILGKAINNILANYYMHCNRKLKSEKIRNCASFLQFRAYEDEEKTRKLYRANFCEHPLCLMCAWRLSMKRSRELVAAVDLLRKDNPEGRFYFLTLTVKNWKIISKDRLKKLQKQGVEFIREVLGTSSYYVSLEITIGKDGLYHPHLHVLVYTTRYINTTLDYITMYRGAWGKIVKAREHNYQILTIFPIARGVEGEKSLHEVTKYILKPKMKITREMVINVSKSLENIKKGFSSGKVRTFLREAKKGIYERDNEELEKLEAFDWKIGFYKWLNNNYVLEME